MNGPKTASHPARRFRSDTFRRHSPRAKRGGTRVGCGRDFIDGEERTDGVRRTLTYGKHGQPP
jgi:hypothetical protein